MQPQIKRYAEDTEGLQRSLFITTIFVVVGMALYLYTVATVKEQVIREVPAPSSGELRHPRAEQALVVRRKPGLPHRADGPEHAGAYYAIYVLNDAQYIAWNAVAQAVGTFAIAAFIPTIVRSMGKRNGYIVPGRGSWPAPSSRTPRPRCRRSPSSSWALGSAASTPHVGLEADTVEYGEWKTGIRTEGTTYALFSFTRKMGQAPGGAAGAFTLGLVAFNSQAATEGAPQAASTVDGIQF